MFVIACTKAMALIFYRALTHILERPERKQKCTISLQQVEETLEEGEEEEVMVDEVPIGETKKSMRIVSGAEKLIIGVGSAPKRTTSARGAVRMLKKIGLSIKTQALNG